MYCIQCGVKLADSEQACPLCGTRVFHPDLQREPAEPTYPRGKYPKAQRRSFWPSIFLTAVFLLPLFIVLLCDMQFNHTVTWSGYVIGALILGYVTLVLPTWFRKPHPVIFVPCDFAAAALYLLYINLITDGDWFLGFALPVVGGLGLIVTAVVTLVWYLRRGRLYIFGGAFILLGGFALLLEFLMVAVFPGVSFIGWSFYPLITLVLLGGMLIFLGICRPARETMERKFFI